MRNALVYPAGNTAACRYASEFMKRAGIQLVDHPTPEITHLLLDVPSFDSDGLLRGGGELKSVLERLPANVTVVGGNLSHKDLENYATIDLLKDPRYLASNAAITADCALQVAAPLLTSTFADTPCLVIGWGRIGKCLAQLLRSIGSDVTIAARKETDRAMIHALGFRAVCIDGIEKTLSHYKLIFNTAPEIVLRNEQLNLCENCVKIDLASKAGMEGTDVVWARGLPGLYAPESSGRLIADTFFRLWKEASK